MKPFFSLKRAIFSLRNDSTHKLYPCAVFSWCLSSAERIMMLTTVSFWQWSWLYKSGDTTLERFLIWTHYKNISYFRSDLRSGSLFAVHHCKIGHHIQSHIGVPSSVKWTDREGKPRLGDRPLLHHSLQSHFLVLLPTLARICTPFTVQLPIYGRLRLLLLRRIKSPFPLSRLTSPVVRRFGGLLHAITCTSRQSQGLVNPWDWWALAEVYTLLSTTLIHFGTFRMLWVKIHQPKFCGRSQLENVDKRFWVQSSRKQLLDDHSLQQLSIIQLDQL